MGLIERIIDRFLDVCHAHLSKYDAKINPLYDIMNKIETLEKNYQVLSYAIENLDLSVFEQKDGTNIANWLESARELCKIYSDFETGTIPPDD